MISNYYRTTQGVNELQKIALSISREDDPTLSFKNMTDKICSVWKILFSSCCPIRQNQAPVEMRPLIIERGREVQK